MRVTARRLLGGLRCLVGAGMTDRNAERIMWDVQRRQRDRGEEQDLTHRSEQRRSEPDRRLPFSEKNRCVALNQPPHRGTPNLSEWNE